MANKLKSGRRPRRRSSFKSRRYSAVPVARRSRRRSSGRIASALASLPSLQRPMALVTAAAAGGAGVLGTSWLLGKVQEKVPRFDNPYLRAGAQVVIGTMLAGLVAKLTKNRAIGSAIAYANLGVAGAALISEVRARGVSGIGLGPTSSMTLRTPSYEYRVNGVGEGLPEAARVAAGM